MDLHGALCTVSVCVWNKIYFHVKKIIILSSFSKKIILLICHLVLINCYFSYKSCLFQLKLITVYCQGNISILASDNNTFIHKCVHRFKKKVCLCPYEFEIYYAYSVLEYLDNIYFKLYTVCIIFHISIFF